ncbi:MAG: O-antigen ligase family protein [Pseudomonadota bacterium]
MNWIIYFLFVSVSMANLTIGGEVYVAELAAFIALSAILMKGIKDNSIKRLVYIDIIILVYAFFSLTSVASGAEHLWESARYYRANILTPTLIYFAFRFLPVTPKLFKRGLYFMLPMIVIQCLLLIKSFVLIGGRQQFFEGHLSYTITLAALFVVGASVVWFLRKEDKSTFKTILTFGLMVIIITALYLTFSRTSLGGFLMLAPIATYVWKRPALVRLSGTAVISGLMLFLVLLFTSSVVYKGSDIDIAEQRELQNSSDRLFNVNLFIQDITGRFKMWGGLTERAMENPILGGGGASYSTAKRGHHIASSHNILISVLLVAGIPGILLFIVIIMATYKCFNVISKRSGLMNDLGKLLWVSYTALIMVAITGGLSGGRLFLFYALMGMIARLSVEKSNFGENDTDEVVNTKVVNENVSTRMTRLR